MKYDWEKKIEKRIDFDEMDFMLPKDYVVLGVAVANVESVEACFIPNPDWMDFKNDPFNITLIDLWGDVGGDVDRIEEYQCTRQKDWMDPERKGKDN